jgi:transketolase
MRKQLIATVEDLLEKDERVVLLLGDIGVYGFRQAFKRFPTRVYNIGILEQATVSLAAGLAMDGMIPIFHTIAPFLAERALEQIKDDFGYQGLGGNFVSVGASYDYAALGCTHQCPGDVQVLKSIPNMQIVVPGSTDDFDRLFRQAYDNPYPTYFRLSEQGTTFTSNVEFAKADVLRQGTLGTVIAVGPVVSMVMVACAYLDVTVLYYTTVQPFDRASLRENCDTGKVAVVEPYYEGTSAYEVQESLRGRSVNALNIGVPRKFLTGYGRIADQNEACGLTVGAIRERLVAHFDSGE